MKAPHSLAICLALLALPACGNSSGDASSGASGTPSGAAAEGSGAQGSGATGGSDTPQGGAGATGTAGGPSSSAGASSSNPGDPALGDSVGCAGVFNPDQVLEYHLTLDENDLQTLLADTTYSLYFPAQLACGDEPPLSVAVQRKRSGGAQKVGLKIDVNQQVAGQTFYGLKKLGFENGVSSGSDSDDAEVRDVLGEYLAWRVVQLAAVMGSRAAIARVVLNGGEPLAYAHVEQVDKRFLESRLGEDGGWLYKKSGGDGDGLKTHETDGVANPHESYFCFWLRGPAACAVPDAATLADELPQRLDIPQLLGVGAVAVLMGNTDTLLFKDNNYYFYDSVAGLRTYLPWDLDTTQRATFDVLDGSVPGGTTQYTDVLFTNWQQDYRGELQRVLSLVTPSAIEAELTRVDSVARDTLDADPYLDGTTQEASEALQSFWQARLAEVETRVAQ